MHKHGKATDCESIDPNPIILASLVVGIVAATSQIAAVLQGIVSARALTRASRKRVLTLIELATNECNALHCCIDEFRKLCKPKFTDNDGQSFVKWVIGRDDVPRLRRLLRDLSSSHKRLFDLQIKLGASTANLKLSELEMISVKKSTRLFGVLSKVRDDKDFWRLVEEIEDNANKFSGSLCAIRKALD